MRRLEALAHRAVRVQDAPRAVEHADIVGQRIEGLLPLLARCDERLLRLLAVGDIAQDGEQPEVGQLAGVELAVEERAILALEPPLAARRAALQQARDLERDPQHLLGRDQIRHREAQELGAGVAKHLVAGGVDVEIGPVGIADEDHVGRLLDEGAVARLAGLQLGPGPLAVGDIPEGHHHAGHNPHRVHDRRRAALDRDGDGHAVEQAVGRAERHHHALAEGLGHGVAERRLGRHIDKLEDALDRDAARVRQPPTGQRLGHGVHEANLLVRADGDDAIGDAGQGRRVVEVALHQSSLLMLVPAHRHLDSGQEVALLEGFDQVAEWGRRLGALQGGLVGVGGEVDHGDVQAAVDVLGGLDAVHLALEPDIHQDEIRTRRLGEGDGLGAPVGDPDDLVAQAPQPIANLLGDQGLVLDHKDAYPGGCVSAHRRPG